MASRLARLTILVARLCSLKTLKQQKELLERSVCKSIFLLLLIISIFFLRANFLEVMDHCGTGLRRPTGGFFS